MQNTLFHPPFLFPRQGGKDTSLDSLSEVLPRCFKTSCLQFVVAGSSHRAVRVIHPDRRSS